MGVGRGRGRGAELDDERAGEEQTGSCMDNSACIEASQIGRQAGYAHGRPGTASRPWQLTPSPPLHAHCPPHCSGGSSPAAPSATSFPCQSFCPHTCLPAFPPFLPASQPTPASMLVACSPGSDSDSLPRSTEVSLNSRSLSTTYCLNLSISQGMPAEGRRGGVVHVARGSGPSRVRQAAHQERRAVR